jgi:hypothetical protein
MEHPADRGYRPFASIFVTKPWKQFAIKHNVAVTYLNQCMYSAPTKNATNVGGVLRNSHSLSCHCCHRKHAKPSFGRSGARTFHSSDTSTYPSKLCHKLADLYVKHHYSFGGTRDSSGEEPARWIGQRAYTATGLLKRTAPLSHGTLWPERSSGDISALFAGCGNAEALPGGALQFQ